MTPPRVYDVPEVLSVHVVPSVEVRMVPDSPTVTKSPFRPNDVPEVTPFRLNDVPEVLEVHVIPSEEVRMVPKPPTITKSPFS